MSLPARIPVLRDPPVVLRGFADRDVGLVVDAAADPYILAVTTVPAEPDEAAARAWLARQHRRLADGEGYSFAIADAASNQPVGQIGLWLRDLAEGRATVGYWVAPAHRGRGYAVRALRLLSAWALALPSIHRLQLYVDPVNAAPCRVAEGAGYTREGLLRRWQAIAGVRRDLYSYSLVAPAAAPARSLSSRLQQVWWIGGGSGAGKSTVARRLAARHGLRVYATDETMADHAERVTPGEAPSLHEFLAMGMDQRWVDRPPAVMLETFHWFRGEGFAAIVEDLLRLPAEPGVIIEGFRLLPHLVAPLLPEPDRAVWLLPSPEFRRMAFEGRRGTAMDIPGRTRDPERARRNLLERDRMFTDRLREETKRLALPVIEVGLGMDEDELVARVGQAFGL